MIHGINFGCRCDDCKVAKLPADLRIKFSERRSMGNRVMARLEGICDTEEERDAMLVVANNGHRTLHVEERKAAGGKILYGIYVY